MKHTDELGTDALWLRPISSADVTERYVSWLNDPDVTSGTEARHHDHTIDAVRDYVDAAEASPNDKLWRIMVDADNHIGNIRLSAINRTHHRARIALLIGEKGYWGRGIGTDAIRLVAAHAFNDMELHKLTAGIYANNVASRRAFEKAGFALEATLAEEAVYDGTFIDVWLLTRFAGDAVD
ncbi:MAG: GNAT family N-acetyltransferase [Rhodospirillales bacterium]